MHWKVQSWLYPSQLQLWNPDSQSFLINLSASLWTLPISKKIEQCKVWGQVCLQHTYCRRDIMVPEQRSWSALTGGGFATKDIPRLQHRACIRRQPFSSLCQFKCQSRAGSWFIASHAITLASWKWEWQCEAPDATTECRTHGVKVSLNDAVPIAIGQAADTTPLTRGVCTKSKHEHVG